MWVPKAVADWFQISKESVDALREELAATKAERDVLRNQLTFTQVNFDWLRIQTNALQMERTALMEKAYGIKIPAPEIVQSMPKNDPTFDPKQFSFEDMGEDLAKRLGFPKYEHHVS